ncbi:hypothetical protein GPU89_12090 [Burkholderia cepacia]|nr:hypothetical protein [Burkholderia cepacia]
MENLWPRDSLLADVPNQDAWSLISELLDAQAIGISERTSNLVQGRIRSENIEGVGVWKFSLWPRLQEQKAYELLRVRCPFRTFPAVVETYSLPEKLRYQNVDTFEQLTAALKKSLRDRRSSDIVRTLAREAALSVANVERELGLEPPLGNARGRLLEVEDLMSESGMTFARVNLFGVKVYVDEREIKAIVTRPNTKMRRLPERVTSSL